MHQSLVICQSCVACTAPFEQSQIPAIGSMLGKLGRAQGMWLGVQFLNAVICSIAILPAMKYMSCSLRRLCLVDGPSDHVLGLQGTRFAIL